MSFGPLGDGDAAAVGSRQNTRLLGGTWKNRSVEPATSVKSVGKNVPGSSDARTTAAISATSGLTSCATTLDRSPMTAGVQYFLF